MSAVLKNVKTDDIMTMVGHAMFHKLPKEDNKKECQCLLVGKETVLAKFDPFKRYSEGLLSVDFTYEFQYTFDFGTQTATVVDFAISSPEQPARAPQSNEPYDKESVKKLVENGKKFGDLCHECQKTFKGTVLHFAAQGIVDEPAEKIEEKRVFTLLTGEEIPLRCVICEKYLLTNNPELVKKGNAIRVKGFWSDNILYVNEIFSTDEEIF